MYLCPGFAKQAMTGLRGTQICVNYQDYPLKVPSAFVLSPY